MPRQSSTAMARLIPWIIFNAANLTYDVLNHANLLLSFRNEEGLRSALTLGNTLSGRRNCIWRRDSEPCPSQHIIFSRFYMDGNKRQQDIAEFGNEAWVRSRHDYAKPTVVLVHGYAGVADHLPMGVLRDAYMGTGRYNVYQADWSDLSAAPCYPAAVYNMRGVARCTAAFFNLLRKAGVPPGSITCVGHSLGAHVCGVTADFLNFPMHKIIGIDPARPLIRAAAGTRLDQGDAAFVVAIHATHTYGDARQLAGHADFCINGATKQPYCANTTDEALCSHVRSVCYLADSLYHPQMATPCLAPCFTSKPRMLYSRGQLPMGHDTPQWAKGLYCMVKKEAPFCPTKSNPIGNPLCCVPNSYGF